MEERTRRIVDTAVTLAEEGGYEAVRLRDVAAQAGVALGTVYKRFRCKEDILVAALERDALAFKSVVDDNPVAGNTPVERVNLFFEMATRVFLMKPNLARAVIRAMASGETEVAQRIASFRGVIGEMIIDTIRGENGDLTKHVVDERMAFLLQQIWYAALAGWMSGLHDGHEVVEQMNYAIESLLGPGRL
jgi:AcrR family transcriptional regulator